MGGIEKIAGFLYDYDCQILIETKEPAMSIVVLRLPEVALTVSAVPGDERHRHG